MRSIVLAAVLLLLAAAPAAAKLQKDVLIDIDQTGPVDVDLDSDGAAERLSSRLLEDGFLHVPMLQYACGERRLGPRNERVVIELDRIAGSTAAPLVVTYGSSGASGRIQTTWAARLLAPARPGACPTLQTVFRFPDRRTRMPRPPRGTEPGSFSSATREVNGRIWFRSVEGLYRRDDAGCCPSYTRTIDWRPKGAGYVRAKTRVRRLPRP
jgi:hypothetical protein